MGSRFKRRLPSGKFIVYRMDCQANGKSYIGITNNFKNRLAEHWYNAKKGKGTRIILYNTIRKYGKESFIITKIDNTKTWREACEKEKRYIKEFSTKTPCGMNMTNGGDGAFGLKVSKEERQRRSKIYTGKGNPNSKLDDYDILEIRRQYKEENITQNQLAEKYNISRHQISVVLNGKSWQHIYEGTLSLSEIKQKGRRLQKARTPKGENISISKLTKFEVIAIRKKYKEGEVSQNQLAEKYNISKSTIARIIIGKTWKHIDEGILSILEVKKRVANSCSREQIGEKNHSSKLIESEIIDIRKRYEKGDIFQYLLAKKYNISKAQINRIIRREVWTHI